MGFAGRRAHAKSALALAAWAVLATAAAAVGAAPGVQAAGWAAAPLGGDTPDWYILTRFRMESEERHTASELAAVRRLLQASGSLPTCEINLEYWVANATSRAVAARLVIANNRELRTDHWQVVYRYLDYQKLKLSSVTGAIALGMGSTSGAPVRLVDAFEEGAGIAAGGSYAFGANAALVAPPAGGNESLLIQGVNVNGLQCSQLAPAQEDRLPYRACAAALSSTAAPGGGDACRAEFCCGYILKDPSAVPPPAPAAPPPPPPPPQQLLLLPPADTAPPAVEDPGASEVGAGLPPVGASPAPDNSNDGGDRSLLQQPSPPPAGGVAPLVGGVVGAAAALAAAVAATAVILARRQKARAVADAAPAAVAAAAATEAAAPAKPPPPPERSRSGASTLASALARGSLGTLTLRHVTAGGGRAAHRGGSEGGSGADSPGEGGARSGRGTPSSAAAMPELPQEVTLFEQLGSGAFGTVYRGEWQGSRVAVKVLTTACATSSRELDSFRQEVAVLSRLRHPHIVAFLAACTVPPNICIIEELAEGGSLHARLHGRPGARRAAPLPLAALLQIAADVAEALVYLHPRIVHRDLKAQNVLLDGQGRGKVCDFGIAKFKDRTFVSTVNGQAGTPSYMAPELFDGAPVTEKVDVYSYGILLWEMFTGEIPWGKVPSPMQIIYYVGVMQQRPPLPDHCPPDLRALIQACWADAPQARPAFTAVLTQLRAMQAALEAAPPAAAGANVDEAAAGLTASSVGTLSSAAAGSDAGGAARGSTQTAEALQPSFGSQALHSYASGSSQAASPRRAAPASPAAAAGSDMHAAWL